MKNKKMRIISSFLPVIMTFFLLGCNSWGSGSSTSGNFKVQDYQTFNGSGGDIVTTHVTGVPFNLYVFSTDNDQSDLVSAYQAITFSLLLVNPNGTEQNVGNYTIQQGSTSVGPIPVTCSTAGQWRVKIAYNLTDSGASAYWTPSGNWHEDHDNHGNGGQGHHYGWDDDGHYQRDPDCDGDDDKDKDFAVAYSDYFTVVNPALNIIPNTSIVYVGSAVQYSVNATAGYLPQNLQWRSSNSGIATVDNTGKVTGQAPGNVTITVTDANNLSDSQPIQVLPSGLTISPATTFIFVNKSLQYSVSYTNGSQIQSATWSSSNPSVATVSGNGLVTGISTGQSTITVQVTSSSGSNGNNNNNNGNNGNHYGNGNGNGNNGNHNGNDDEDDNGNGNGNNNGNGSGNGNGTTVSSVSLTITVTAPSISPQNQTVYVGYPVQFTLTYSGGYQPTGTPTWSTSNTNIATVDNNGVVTGLAAGTCTLKATGDSGVQATTTITVANQATATISPNTNRVFIGVPVQYAVAYTGINQGSAQTVWGTSDSTVATVDGTGLVSGVNPGSCTITVKDQVSGASDSLGITVVGVTVSPSTRTVFKGTPVQYTLSFSGGYQPGTLTWSSSDPSIATVDGNGNVAGLKAGNCTITVSDSSGTVVSIPITVIVPTASISGPGSINYNGTGNYIVTFTSGYTPQSPLQWTANPAGVASIQSSYQTFAVVKGLKGGSLTLSVTDPVSGATASYQVTVSSPTVSISGPASINVGASATYTVSFTNGYQPQSALQWSIDNTGIASKQTDQSTSVSLQGLQAGSFTLTVRDPDSLATASQIINVVQPVLQTGITITPSLVTITGATTPGDESYFFKASFVWSDGSTTPVTNGITWALDSNLATIDSNGVVTVPSAVLMPQVVTVTATYNNYQATANLALKPTRGGVIWHSEE